MNLYGDKKETEKMLKSKEELINMQKVLTNMTNNNFVKLDTMINELQLKIEKKVLLEDFDGDKFLPLINIIQQAKEIFEDITKED